MGRYIYVAKAEPPAQGGGYGGQGASEGGESSSIFVGNISYNTTEDSLYEFFGQCGTIQGARVAKD